MVASYFAFRSPETSIKVPWCLPVWIVVHSPPREETTNLTAPCQSAARFWWMKLPVSWTKGTLSTACIITRFDSTIGTDGAPLSQCFIHIDKPVCNMTRHRVAIHCMQSFNFQGSRSRLPDSLESAELHSSHLAGESFCRSSSPEERPLICSAEEY